MNTLLGRTLNSNQSASQFKGLHQYACDPANYWPQIRNKVKHLSSTFDSIRDSGELIWTQKASLICDQSGKYNGEHGLTGGGLTTSKLIELLKSAEYSVNIQTPYLITSESTRNVFKTLVDNNVSIRILTNSLASTDNVEAFSGYQRDREALLNTGVRVFEFRPDAAVRLNIASNDLQNNLGNTAIFGTHAKTMVIDNAVTVIGTFNLDPRSANLNTECLAIVEDKTISNNVLKGIEEEFKAENSWEVTSQWNPDHKVGVKKRLKTWTRKIIPKNVL